MQDPVIIMTIAAACLLAIAIVAATTLRLWNDWMRYKQTELTERHRIQDNNAQPSSNTRIELADLKERLRKLEAIAAGVDP